jgi:hypothetical protein
MNPPKSITRFATPLNTNGWQRKMSAMRQAELEFRWHIERLAEVCWEMTRAWIRSGEDTSTASDMRIPVKWASAGLTERAATHAAVLNWWQGIEEPAAAAAINHMCRAVVLEYRKRLTTEHTEEHRREEPNNAL